MNRKTKEIEMNVTEILEQHKLWITDPIVGRKAVLIGADLRDANLSEADLRGADLRGTDLRGASLRHANLSRADLRGTNLRWADLSGIDLSDANLTGANLANTNLTRANLSYANLANTSMSDADLSDADLSHADLTGADLTGAYLRWANLSGADGKFVFFQVGRFPAVFAGGYGCIGYDYHTYQEWLESGAEILRKNGCSECEELLGWVRDAIKWLSVPTQPDKQIRSLLEQGQFVECTIQSTLYRAWCEIDDVLGSGYWYYLNRQDQHAAARPAVFTERPTIFRSFEELFEEMKTIQPDMRRWSTDRQVV
jgi:uncharacterized protein YjbI with pentapeptide repeats